MRLNFKLSPNRQTVYYNYQHSLIGVFHKWLGENKLHDELSLYSLSWLAGSHPAENGFDFPNGAGWFISSWDENIVKSVIAGIMKDPALFCGMEVEEIQMQETPCFGARERFVAASPIFIRKPGNDKELIHLTYDNEEADACMTNTMLRKLKKAGLGCSVKISFDRSYAKAKTKLVTINNIESRSNFCPVIVEGDREAVQFAWNVGIGNSTGSAFGAVRQ